jgi:peptidoglycan hydrolase-like protein with peptidoglycan-binding domain
VTLALTGPFIAAAGYTKGRSFAERPAVNILVVHTAEGALDEVNLGNYFHSTTRGSSHGGIGQDGGYAQYVNFADTCWAAPPLNQEGEHLELCAFAKWTRAQWLAQPRLLETLAKWLAWRCTVRRIPIVLLEPVDIAAGKPGITDHRRVNATYHKSDHWDVGYNLPWDVVIPRARQLAAVTPSPTPTGTFYVVKAGDTLTSIARRFKTTVAALAAANGIKDPSSIKVGQRIKIVVAGGSTPPKTGVIGAFPYPSDHYFSTPATSPRNHSGAWLVDQKYVRMIQQEVGATIDGHYGTGTRSKVIAYQTKYGLARDGVVGPVTWRRMAAS